MDGNLNELLPRQNPETWMHSRWSAQGWGVHSSTWLMCDPDRCRYRDRRECSAPPGSGHCCPYETTAFQEYLNGYHHELGDARDVLGDDNYLEQLRELCLLHLRQDRLSMRMNWLSLNTAELVTDVDFFEAEVERTCKYETTIRNKWWALYQRLKEASRSPFHGIPHIEKVGWLMSWTKKGVGPACDLETRQLTWEGVYDPLRDRLIEWRYRSWKLANETPEEEQARIEREDAEAAANPDPWVEFFAQKTSPP